MSNGKGTKQRCACGYRRRGSNHDKGQHHQQGKAQAEADRRVVFNFRGR